MPLIARGIETAFDAEPRIDQPVISFAVIL